MSKAAAADPDVQKAIRALTPRQAFALWDKYEQIAMHFNDMLIKWRLQVVSGLATLVTLAGVIVHSVQSTDWRGIAPLVGTALLVVWCAVAALDMLYYSNLLRGAVDAILELEAVRPEFRCSTRIKEASGKRLASHGAGWFYGIVGIGLAVFIVWSWATTPASQFALSDGCACSSP